MIQPASQIGFPKRRQRKWLVLSTLVALLLPVAHADVAEIRQQLANKIRLVGQLTAADSAASQRIVASGNVTAITHFDQGRADLALAESQLLQDDLGATQRSVDEALRHISLAYRAVPDEATRAAAERQRHGQLMNSMDRLLQTYRDFVQRGHAKDGGDLNAAEALVADARRLARDHRFAPAIESLVRAERHVLVGMTSLLRSGTLTLDYTARFDTQEQEFEYEWVRHGSMAELVPIAVADLQPKGESLAEVERNIDTANALAVRARRNAQLGDHTVALREIRNATMHIQRALNAAGLVTPTH